MMIGVAFFNGDVFTVPSLLKNATICFVSRFFFFNDTPTTEIYPLPLHDALPILVLWSAAVLRRVRLRERLGGRAAARRPRADGEHAERAGDAHHRQHADQHRHDRAGRPPRRDRKSTRLNSSHDQISCAVFCLKKKKLWASSRSWDVLSNPLTLWGPSLRVKTPRAPCMRAGPTHRLESSRAFTLRTSCVLPLSR